MAQESSGQIYRFGFGDSVLAEVAHVPQAALHTDVDAVCRAYEAIVPVADRLGAEPPSPRLAGLAYNHASTLGAEVTISPDSPEPAIKPFIKSLEQIDNLQEPEDYLSAGIVPQRLELTRRISQRRPDASGHIGHDYEGPVTTAALLMGQDFFMLPYDDPDRAHRLMDFCTTSAINYVRALSRHQNRPSGPGPVGIPDDFAGMFPPDVFGRFVAPYWEKLYRGLEATHRNLHSEMLRREHLPFLADLKIDNYDTAVNNFLTPEILKSTAGVPFGLLIWPSQIRDMSADELVRQYRHLAGFSPTYISFALNALEYEPKIVALLEVARELE